MGFPAAEGRRGRIHFLRQIGHPLSAMETRRDSIDQAEERAFKELAELTLAFSDDELRQLIKAGVYKELKNDG